MTTTALTTKQDQTLSKIDIMADLAKFLRLHTQDASSSSGETDLSGTCGISASARACRDR